MGGQRVNRRLLSVAAATVAIAVGALALAGCSDDSEGATGPERDLTALQCPMVETGQNRGVSQYRPAKNAFDTAELLGMQLAEAREKAARHDCEIVVAREDDKSQPVPIEVDPTRIYVYIAHGTVSQIEGVGGGL
ncbi:hypothetical protein [Micromonospora sp. CB01531]|uniref:hypothetical protein n=1 Tax=Micromonospora sp. CB01531 TaxID=1718947 RepID=UPI00093BFC6A|nr:hypothetical protein [Micromonospora sp. CB01531]OKI54823.1 hypothetical protein A6A27_31320 [Micromonospora sp. CB01531]